MSEEGESKIDFFSSIERFKHKIPRGPLSLSCKLAAFLALLEEKNFLKTFSGELLKHRCQLCQPCKLDKKYLQNVCFCSFVIRTLSFVCFLRNSVFLNL